MTAPIIEVDGLTFGYGPHAVLHEVSFTVHPGEHLAIIGPNGAGKSTLLKCLDRLVEGFRGTLRVQGRDLSTYSQRELARVVSYVPQGEGRDFPFTCREFVAMGRYPHLSPFTVRRPEDEQAVDDALARAGLMPMAERRMDTLSGGERQRLLIAAAMAQGAALLLLDEPTTFLDPKHRQEVEQLLSLLNHESGVTLVAVTHDLNRAVRSADRVLVLKEGRVCYLGPTDGLFEGDALAGLFGRTFDVADHPAGGRMILPD